MFMGSKKLKSKESAIVTPTRKFNVYNTLHDIY